MIIGIIDRFEGEYAVMELEDGKTFINVPRQFIPPNAKEGDVINVTIDENKTKSRKEHIAKLMDSLWKKV